MLLGLPVATAALALLAPVQLPLPVPLPTLPPLPPPPPLCLEPPLPPICITEPPPPGDDPPKLPDAVTVTREGKEIVLRWKAATDDVGVWGYRIYRDGNLIQRKAKTARRAIVRFPCGKHSFRVEAVDTVEQTASRSVHVRRPC